MKKFNLRDQVFWIEDGVVKTGKIVSKIRRSDIRNYKDLMTNLYQVDWDQVDTSMEYETIDDEGHKEYWDGEELERLFITQEELFQAIKIAS